MESRIKIFKISFVVAIILSFCINCSGGLNGGQYGGQNSTLEAKKKAICKVLNLDADTISVEWIEASFTAATSIDTRQIFMNKILQKCSDESVYLVLSHELCHIVTCNSNTTCALVEWEAYLDALAYFALHELGVFSNPNDFITLHEHLLKLQNVPKETKLLMEGFNASRIIYCKQFIKHWSLFIRKEK